MKLGVLLAIGEKWEDFEDSGQDRLLLNNNYVYYSKAFTYIYIFSYGKKNAELGSNIELVGQKQSLHRYIYTLFLPLIQRKYIKDVSVLRGMQLSSVIPLVIAKFLYRKKIVLNYGYDYTKFATIEKKYLQACLYWVLERFFLRFVDNIIVPNLLLLKKVSQFTKNQIEIIPNSINIRVFSPKYLKQKKIDILYVGRLERQKNLMLLIKAVSKLKDLRLKVLFIGIGSQKKHLIAQARKNKVNLKITGPIPHDELSKYYNEARIFVLPSFIEGNPKVLLEAMSCEMPVIGADVTGIRGIIKNHFNGLLFQPNSIDLARTIKNLYTDTALQRNISIQARKTISKYFNSAVLWKSEIRLLKKLGN